MEHDKRNGGFLKIGKVPVPDAVSRSDAEAKATLDRIHQEVSAGRIRRGSSSSSPTSRPAAFTAWRFAVKMRLSEERENEQGLPGSAPNAVLSGLLMHVNDAGEASPGVETLAVLAGVDERTVRRCLRQWEAAGWIEPGTRRYGARGAMVRRFAWPLPELPGRPRRRRSDAPP